MTDTERKLTLSTQLVFSVHHLPNVLKVYWSELLEFHFHNELSQTQISDLEASAVLNNLKSENDVFEAYAGLPKDDRLWVVCAMKMLVNKATEISDVDSKSALDQLLKRCLVAIPEVDEKIIENKWKEWAKAFQEFNKRKYFIVPGSISLFTLDYILRWLILALSNRYSLENFRTTANFIIPVLIFFVAFLRARKDRIFNEKLVASKDFKAVFGFQHRYTTNQYTLLALYLISGALISSLVFESLVGGIFSMIGLLLYYILLTQMFPTGRLRESALEIQLAQKDQIDYKDADENDERIVLIETNLNANSGRLEAYVLESALFGALAFSAFLQIFATNLISFSDVEKFASAVQKVAHGFILANWSEFYKSVGALGNKESLFSLISIETLICSGLFVAVIASRLRFSRIADLMRADINLAKAYNEKEEKILESGLPNHTNNDRFYKINQRVHDQLERASVRLREIEPVVKYIVYFRNMGVIVFGAVLVTSCLFISSALAWAFLLVTIVTWIYFNYDTLTTWISGLRLNAKIFVLRFGYTFPLILISPIVIGFLLKVNFGVSSADQIISFSYLLLGFYFASISLLSYYDAKFGEITGKAWKTIRIFYAISILFGVLGLTMKMEHIDGANELFILGFSGLTSLNFVLPFYLTKPKWASATVAFALGTSTCSFLFWGMRWVGWPELATIFTFIIPFCWLLVLLRRNLFHKSFIKILLVNTIIIMLITRNIMFLDLESSALGRIRLAYQHETFRIGQFLNVIGNMEIKIEQDVRSISENDIKKSIGACDEYLQKYGTSYGITEVHRAARGIYGGIAEELTMDTRRKPDSISLTKAYLCIEEADKIARMFKYEFYLEPEITIAVLEQMGKKDELIKYYERILSMVSDYNLKDDISKRLEKIRKTI